MMSKLFALMLPAVALGFFTPAAAPPRASTARFNFQPNRDYNAFGAADSLSREERSQRFANAGDREVTLQKPLGVVLKGCDLVVKRGPDARVRLKTHLSSAASSTVHKSNCRGASTRHAG